MAGPYNTIDQPVETKNKMAKLNVPYLVFVQIFLFKDKIEQINEPPRGKPRGIFKGKIHSIAASCGELNPKRD